MSHNLFEPKPYEKIAYQGRRHYLTFVPYVILTLGFIFIPPILYAMAKYFFPNFSLEATGMLILTMVISTYYLFTCFFFYSCFIDFYLDILIITNDRLIHIEQESLFARTVSEMDLCKLQDVTSEVNGILPSIFHYGTILIQSAGATDKFVLYNVPNPNHLRTIIMDMANEDQKGHLPHSI